MRRNRRRHGKECNICFASSFCTIPDLVRFKNARIPEPPEPPQAGCDQPCPRTLRLYILTTSLKGSLTVVFWSFILIFVAPRLYFFLSKEVNSLDLELDLPSLQSHRCRVAARSRRGVVDQTPSHPRTSHNTGSGRDRR